MKKHTIPVIHIGYPKSASTTLQKNLFNKHPDILNLGLFPTLNIGKDSDYIDPNCAYLKDKKVEEFYYNLVMLNSIEYEYRNNVNLFKHIVKKYIRDNRIPLFSNERFVSVFFSHNDIVAKANRLKEIFPEAKILVIIRNQYNLIISQYRDHPFDPRNFLIGKSVSLSEWLKIAYNYQHISFLNSLKYNEVIKYYAKLFGKENIGIFLLEDLVFDFERFSLQISDFINIDFQSTLECLQNKRENTAVSARYNSFRKALRKYYPVMKFGKILPNHSRERIINWLKNGSSRKYSIPENWKEKLREYYAESNAKLQNEFKVDLNNYSYPL